MVVFAQHDPRFRAVVNACALSLCDTIGVLLAARRRGARIGARVTGVELVEALCARAAHDGLSVYFLGGAPGVALKAAQELERQHPGLHVAGTQNGFFDAEQSSAIASEIRASGARILFVGLGSPRQEFWLADYLAATGCGAGIGVGGSFDVISGNVRRAPEMFRRLGVEWLYRLLKEPQRWRRQLALPYFALLVVLDELRGHKRSSNLG